MNKPQYTPGRFVWHELFTNDIERSRSFYQGLFGWTVDLVPMPGMDYHMIKAGGVPVGGIMPLSVVQQPGVPPFWMGFVSVPDVDAAAAAARQSGGQVLAGPHDAGTFGRFATLMDPQGAVVSAWKSNEGDPPLNRPDNGQFCWDHLATSDPDAASTFYERVFGWKRVPFGESSGMEVFVRGEQQFAGGVGTTEGGAPPHWMTFVVVPELSTARNRVRELGGTVLVDQVDVPTVGSFAVVRDNVGAVIAPFQGLPDA